MEIRKGCKKEILELMRKHKLTETQVLEIYKAQWRFVKEVMKEDLKKELDERVSIKLIGIGTFRFSKLAAQFQEKLKKENERKIQLKETTTD